MNKVLSCALTAVLLLASACGYTPTVVPLIMEAPPTAGPRLSDQPEAAIAGPEFDFMTWNIHKESNTREWIEAYLALDNDPLLADKMVPDVDIAVFQEAFLNSGMQYCLLQKKRHWKFLPNLIKNDRYGGLLTASKAAPLNTKPLISAGREPFTATPKAALITEYAIRAGQPNGPGARKIRLVVANVHGMNFRYENRHRDFADQIGQLRDALLPYREDSAIIVAGDFNAWSSDKSAILEKHMINELKLTEVKDCRGLPLEGVATPEWYFWLFTPIERLPLDRVFYSADRLDVESARVLEKVAPSDHKPILVRFRAR